VAADVEQMAPLFRERARELQQAAAERRWSGVTRALGAVTSTCAGCHQAARWREDHGHDDAAR
jgi:cytochrome c556